jgi:RimJ/RimL family protein N-acetyltransferase
MTSGKRVQLPPAPELTDGPDLLLRLPLPSDVDDMVAQCRDPEFQRWTTVPVPYNEADAHEFLQRVAEGWRAYVAAFAIAHERRFAGSVDLRFDGLGGAEVGFGLAPWARGKGVMTRALRLVLAWGFERAGLQVVYWRAQVGNWPSRRVATRCGFRMEGTVRGLLEQRGERRDAWIGSLRRGEPMSGAVEEPAQGR